MCLLTRSEHWVIEWENGVKQKKKKKKKTHVCVVYIKRKNEFGGKAMQLCQLVIFKAHFSQLLKTDR